MLDIQRYQNVAVGNTVAECQKAYQALLATNGVLADSNVDTGSLEAQGTISHIAQAVVEGNSHFYVTLEGDKGIYDFALPGLIEIGTRKATPSRSSTWKPSRRVPSRRSSATRRRTSARRRPRKPRSRPRIRPTPRATRRKENA